MTMELIWPRPRSITRTTPAVADLIGFGTQRKATREIRDDNDTGGTHTTDNTPGGTR
jgi:hypothetical protein